MNITIAIPLLNEEAVASELVKQIKSVIQNLRTHSFTLLFVDDGSSDRTVEIIRKELEASNDIPFLIITLSRNFGHQAALTAALDHASGDAVIIMDGDLQDSPSSIVDFIKYHEQGYDVVYASRSSRSESWILRSCYFIFYRLLHKISRLKIPLDSGDFSLLSKRVVDAINSSNEKHRFIRGLRAWSGFKQIGIPVERAKRFAGKSKYSVSKLFALAFDGLFSFSTVPLRIASACGLLTIIGCLAFLLYSLYVKLVINQSPTGFTALAVSILFTAGVQLFFLGIIGEYVGRIYEQTKNRPTYVIDKIFRNPQK